MANVWIFSASQQLVVKSHLKSDQPPTLAIVAIGYTRPENAKTSAFFKSQPVAMAVDIHSILATIQNYTRGFLFVRPCVTLGLPPLDPNIGKLRG